MKRPLERDDHGLISAGGAASSPLRPAAVLTAADAAASRSRWADYAELAKLRLGLLVLAVTAVGYCLGAGEQVEAGMLLHTVLGTGLVAASANALNQYLERDLDRLMQRTVNRPLPAGRMSQLEALSFGVAAALVGLMYLWWVVNPLAAGLAALTLLLYVVAYTPLKRVTALNTLVGAVPGALPPVIGYAAGRGSLDATAWLLFAILLAWQLPHFFAIAWLYRRDYARAGYRMLSTVDPGGGATRRQTVICSVVLLVVTLLPVVAGMAGGLYAVSAVLLGGGLTVAAWRMARTLDHASARQMMIASIVYLPLLLGAWLLDTALI